MTFPCFRTHCFLFFSYEVINCALFRHICRKPPSKFPCLVVPNTFYLKCKQSGILKRGNVLCRLHPCVQYFVELLCVVSVKIQSLLLFCLLSVAVSKHVLCEAQRTNIKKAEKASIQDGKSRYIESEFSSHNLPTDKARQLLKPLKKQKSPTFDQKDPSTFGFERFFWCDVTSKLIPWTSGLIVLWQ